MDRVPRARRMGRGVAPEPEPAVSRQIRHIEADWLIHALLGINANTLPSMVLDGAAMYVSRSGEAFVSDQLTTDAIQAALDSMEEDDRESVLEGNLEIGPRLLEQAILRTSITTDADGTQPDQPQEGTTVRPVGWRDADVAERVAELAPEEVWRMWVSIMRMTHSYDDIMSRVENTLWNYGDIFSMNGTIGTAETESLQRIYPEEYAFLRHHPSCTITRMEMSIAFEITSTPELVNCMMEHIGRPPFISIGPEPPAANRTRAPTRRIRK